MKRTTNNHKVATNSLITTNPFLLSLLGSVSLESDNYKKVYLKNGSLAFTLDSDNIIKGEFVSLTYFRYMRKFTNMIEKRTQNEIVKHYAIINPQDTLYVVTTESHKIHKANKDKTRVEKYQASLVGKHFFNDYVADRLKSLGGYYIK